MGNIKVIHLFSGVGSPEMALKRLGLPVEFVGFSEIDKYAIQSYKAIHGENTPNLGDIKQINRLPQCNLLIYGSPCQDFSIAGLQRGLVDKEGNQTRSGLLFEVERLLELAKSNNELPNVLLMENVKNLVSKKFKPDFDRWLKKLEELGYNNYWQVLNSKDYEIPQNRERVFVVSILKEEDEGYEFPAKMELSKRLKDVLEKEVEDKYYLSQEKIEKISQWKSFQKPLERVNGRNSISPCLTARGAGEEHSGMITYCENFDTEQNIQKEVLNMVKNSDKVIQIGNITDTTNSSWDNPQRGRIYSIDGISPTITCMQGGGLEPKIIQKVDIPQIVKVRKYEVDIENLKTLLKEHKKLTGLSNSYISSCLDLPQTKVEHWFRTDDCFAIPDAEYWYKLKDILLIKTNEFDEAITTFEEKEGVFEKSNRCYFDTGISPTLTATSADEKIIETNEIVCEQRCDEGLRFFKDNICGTLRTIDSCGDKRIIENDLRIRKLTPKECWRLMGFNDEDFEKAKAIGTSDTQLSINKLVILS